MSTKISLNNTLVMVQIIFRHGDRAPISSFPSDIHKDNKYPPYGPGQLTQRGRQRSFQLGKTLARLYGAFLNNEYKNDVVHAISSGMERCQITLQCVLAGMFPPSKEIQLEEGLNWQPIAYDSFAKNGDKVLAIYTYNPNFFDVVKEQDPETRKFYDYVSIHAKMEIKNSHHFYKVGNALHVQSEMGLELPEWAKAIDPQEMKSRMLEIWDDLANYKLVGTVGLFIQLLTSNLLAKVAGTSPFDTRKLCLFSAHDLNLVGLLEAFSKYEREYINYCSFIAIELHKINDEYFIKILFQNGSEDHSRRQLKLKGGDDNLCSLDEFINFTKWLYS